MVINSIYFELTNSCNLNCSYCCANANNNNKTLDIDKIIRVVNEAKDFGCRSIILSGGEPLLYNNLYELTEYLRANKFKS
jgi:MoaA/NifB/PqqE/SkfB family radical SAM enzyme